MNERIKELALQAGYMEDMFGVGHWDSPECKKLVELIAKEMCGMLEQTEDDLYSLDASERPMAYIEWLYYWRTRFEKHFGIE